MTEVREIERPQRSAAAVDFAAERLSAVWDEAQPLVAAHYREIAHHADIALNPDRDCYFAAEEAGHLRCFTARKETKLIGYAVYFVRHSLHYQQSLQAVQDVLFLDPRERGSAGARFIAWCDRKLRDDGVQLVWQHMKAAHSFGPMLERMGYELIDLVYARRLDTWAQR